MPSAPKTPGLATYRASGLPAGVVDAMDVFVIGRTTDAEELAFLERLLVPRRAGRHRSRSSRRCSRCRRISRNSRPRLARWGTASLWHHAERGDSSRWVHDVLRDDVLAARLAKLERRWCRGEVRDFPAAAHALIRAASQVGS